MRSTLALIVAAAVAPASAQNTTGPGAPAQGQSIPPASMNLISSTSNAPLSVAFGQSASAAVTIQPAQLVGKQIPSTQPQVAINSMAAQTLSNKPLLVMMVDPDAPTPEAPTAGFFLHWMASNMVTTMGGANGEAVLTNSTPNIASYVPPGPPATSSAHRYIFYAFEQPANFALPPQFANVNDANRVKFDVKAFAQAANLGAPVAANFMYVSAQSSVPPTFQAAPNGTFPGGNGNAIGMAGSTLQSNVPGQAKDVVVGRAASVRPRAPPGPMEGPPPPPGGGPSGPGGPVPPPPAMEGGPVPPPPPSLAGTGPMIAPTTNNSSGKAPLPAAASSSPEGLGTAPQVSGISPGPPALDAPPPPPPPPGTSSAPAPLSTPSGATTQAATDPVTAAAVQSDSNVASWAGRTADARSILLTYICAFIFASLYQAWSR